MELVNILNHIIKFLFFVLTAGFLYTLFIDALKMYGAITLRVDYDGHTNIKKAYVIGFIWYLYFIVV